MLSSGIEKFYETDTKVFKKNSKDQKFIVVLEGAITILDKVNSIEEKKILNQDFHNNQINSVADMYRYNSKFEKNGNEIENINQGGQTFIRRH